MNESRNRSGLVIGAILVTVGILSLLGQVTGFWSNGIAWPLIVMGVGLAFIVLMVVLGKSASGLAIPGSIIFVIGLILFVQNLFSIWETWSYAWALIIAAVGLGLIIMGVWRGEADLRQQGWRVTSVGLTLFLVFGAIMEFVFSITGITSRFSLLLWAIVLVLVGLVQLVVRIIRVIQNPEQSAWRNDLFGPIFLMGIGVIGIMGSQGWVSSGRLWSLINLWPLLLIIGGLRLLLGRRIVWVSAVLGVLFVGSILFVAVAGDRLGIAQGSPFMFGPFITSTDNGIVRETVNGSSVVSQAARPVSGFSQVRLEGFGNLIVTQGETEGLTIEAEDNLLPHLTSTVQGQELVLGIEPGFRLVPHKTITYNLTVKNLVAVDVPGAGNVTIHALLTDAMDVQVSGAGKFTLEGLVTHNFTVNLSGAGSIQAAGKVDNLEVNLSGAGNFEGGDLSANSVIVNLSGLGKATVWVRDSLETNISGLGSVDYYGSPTSITKSNSGLGSVNSLGTK